MASISLCMIVRDEEAVLGRCLESVAPAVDEIIVVDTGSMDGTKAVAAAYGVKLIEVLTGFKYIGEQIRFFEEQNTYHYVFGLERHAMHPLPKPPGIISCGWTQTMCFCRRIWMRCCV